MFFPHYLFPPVPDIVKRTVDILITGPLLADVLLTAGAHLRRPRSAPSCSAA